MDHHEMFAQNLKKIMKQLNVSNAQLSRAIGVDPSLVSRWLKNGCNGRNATIYAISIAKYIVEKYISPENAAWLSAELTSVPLPDTAPETARIALWLNPDADVSSILKEERFTNLLVLDSFRGAVSQKAAHPDMKTASSGSPIPMFDVQTGVTGIAGILWKELDQLQNGSEIDIYLSSETVVSATDNQIIEMLRNVMDRKHIKMRILVQSANNSAASSKLVAAYMPLLILGNLQLSMIQGTPQTFITTMNILISDRCVVTVTEVAQRSASPVATVIRESGIINDIKENFERSLRYARPMMVAYNDSFARNIIETFFDEFGTPGSLDIIKCGLNPLYMTIEQFGKILRDIGHKGDKYNWRYQEFVRFKGAMDEVFKESRYREVLSLPKLYEIAETGRCKMPSMYFMESGVWYLDALDCVSVLNGYIRYLQEVPNFSVALLDDESLIMPNSCWHIKNNKHILIHSWDTDEPIMVYSDQILIIDEFQRHFDHMWGTDQ